MREPTFLILTALTDGPQHGYALLQAVERHSDGRVRLRPGSLYGSLDRLVEEGLVVEVSSEVVDGRQRRYYDLTEAGAGALRAHTEQVRAIADRADAGLRRRASGARPTAHPVLGGGAA